MVKLQTIPKMHMKFKNKTSFVLVYQDTMTIKKELSKKTSQFSRSFLNKRILNTEINIQVLP